MRHAWIRGVGAISALGRDWPTTSAALARGECGITPIAKFDTSGMPCRVAAVVDDAWLDEDDVGDRRVQLARRAVAEAVAMAGPIARGDRLGVFIGAESGL